MNLCARMLPEAVKDEDSARFEASEVGFQAPKSHGIVSEPAFCDLALLDTAVTGHRRRGA